MTRYLLAYIWRCIVKKAFDSDVKFIMRGRLCPASSLYDVALWVVEKNKEKIADGVVAGVKLGVKERSCVVVRLMHFSCL